MTAAFHLFAGQGRAVVRCVDPETRSVGLDLSSNTHPLCDLGHIIFKIVKSQFSHTYKMWVIIGSLPEGVVELNVMPGQRRVWHS